MKKEVISSPIRWAGSKKKLLNEMLEETFKKHQKNYVECFLGSAVVLLNVINNNEDLNYENYYVNDINSNIINFYILLQKNPEYLITKIKELSDKYNNLSLNEKSNLFYEIRNAFNCSDNSDEKSIYFYFLMKTGFNGVYRENSKGQFNVPFGRKEKIIIDENYLIKISTMIKKVKFYNLPFEDFLDKMSKKGILDDAFVYCDPPYLPDDLLVYQKQMLYTKDSFNHELFFSTLNEMDIKNVMISMSESKIADQIYNKQPFNKIDVRNIIRVINPKKLFSSKEVAYINYQIEE
ncbi:MAG: DNA adenine methylase [Bacilli bacterium]|nr:DNA adenine methylase [Bacilli bacterium]